MPIYLGEDKKNLTPEVRHLFKELEAYEREWQGTVTDNDFLAMFLEGKVDLMKGLIIQFAIAGGDLSKRLSEAEAEKDLAVHALCELATDCHHLEKLVVKLVSKNQELLGGEVVGAGQVRLEYATNPAEFKSKETFKETQEMIEILRDI